MRGCELFLQVVLANLVSGCGSVPGGAVIGTFNFLLQELREMMPMPAQRCPRSQAELSGANLILIRVIQQPL